MNRLSKTSNPHNLPCVTNTSNTHTAGAQLVHDSTKAMKLNIFMLANLQLMLLAVVIIVLVATGSAGEWHSPCLGVV